MKRFLFFAIAILTSAVASAQSFSVKNDGVAYSFPLEKVGNITFGDGSFFLGGASFQQKSGLQMIYADDTPLKDNEVSVRYNGNNAEVVLAGNLAGLVEAQVRGAHVTLLQSPNVKEEITYTLCGQSSNGSLYMDGKLKATFVLNGLTLHNPDSAAINIQDGKRIEVKLAEGTQNTLSDGIRGENDGSDAHNACLYVDGHTELGGAGSLKITGNVKHGFTSDEYCIVKASAGTIEVVALGDGFHIGQYYEQRGGSVNIESAADGVDVGAKKDPTTEMNGQMIISGGKLSVKTIGDAAKGLKADASIEISGGDINIRCIGNAYYDEVEHDITSSATIKPGTTYTQTNGTVYAVATGIGGKVLNATGAVTFNGGKFTGASCGKVFKYGTDDTKPQGVKSDADIIINGGEVYVAASNDKGTAFKTDFTFAINGGTVMGLGGKTVTASASSTQASRKYTSANVAAGGTVTYDGVSFTVPQDYSNSAAYVIVSRPGL